ncbi:hypothetical protein CDAR_564941 [Caerostris darwini]|uniref:Uncharacterized protein n=1 Tax=Caerostris darwini TaxID=1538125 RepID=A0AAV4URK2_9ARAC|nr:hypothetical protein CDAR_564941 [Caerostris darwini]
MLLSKAQKKTPIRRQELRLELSNGFDLKEYWISKTIRKRGGCGDPLIPGTLFKANQTGNLWRKANSFKKSLKSEQRINNKSDDDLLCKTKRPNSYKDALSRAQKETPFATKVRLGLSNGLDLKNIGFRRRFRRGWRG